MSIKSEFNFHYLQNLAHDFEAKLALQVPFTKAQTTNQISDLKQDSFVSSLKSFQVAYIGASHIESAKIKQIGNQRKIQSFKRKPHTQIQTKQDFENLVLQIWDQKSKHLVINLAAPLQLVKTSNGYDSRLIKNHRFHNFSYLKGKLVGHEISKIIKEKTGRKVEVSVINNLVSLAKLEIVKGDIDNTVTAVVATGVNFGYFENGEFINLESGKWLIENKETSELIGEGSIYKQLNSQFKLEILDYKDLNNLLKTNTKASQLAHKLLRRSATLLSVKLAGIYNFKNKDSDPNYKLKISVEGSLFWQVNGYKELVEKVLYVLGYDLGNFKFSRINYSFLLGASSGLQTRKVFQNRLTLIQEKVYFLIKSFFYHSQAPPNLCLFFNNI